MKNGINQRIVKKTGKNDTSSRSHLIFKIEVNRINRNVTPIKTKTSSLLLVDLAGSERFDIVKTTGDTF